MRVKCAGRGCEHSRSSHDESGACLVCPTLPHDPTGRKGACRGWAEQRPHLWRDYVTTTFWHWRDQWETLYDLECSQTYRPGAIAREKRRERRGGRREVTDFLEQHPVPTLRVVLEGSASAWQEPAA